MEQLQAPGRVRKRKAENQNSERLSKRLSLLNLGLYSLINPTLLSKTFLTSLQSAMASGSTFLLNSRLSTAHHRTGNPQLLKM